MPSDQFVQALRDIPENAQLAQQFVGGLDAVSFAADRRTLYAVTRCLEIISEATRRLEPAIRDRHPGLPWRAIMGSGNVYRHNYDNVAEDQLWRTVSGSLDALIAVAAQNDDF